MLLLMGPYSLLEKVQNEEPLSEFESKPRRNSREREQVSKYLHANPKKQFVDTPYTVDGEFYQIIQILRTTKLQQFKGSYHYDDKFCVVGAIMREKYGCNGNDNIGFGLYRQQLIRILGNDYMLSRIIELNDSFGKSFSDVADWLETIYLKNWS